MTRPTFLLSLAVASATFLGACSSAAPSAPPSPPPAAVDGKTYLSTEVKGAVLVPGTRISLTFKDGNINAQAGCNMMGGAYTITDGRLRTTQMFMTAMGCDEPRSKQDEWLSRLLGDASLTMTGDTLTLDDGTIRVTLLDREVASPDKPIENTRWVLDGIVSGDAVSSVPAGVTASLRIVNGRAEIEAGCNTGGGPVVVSADSLAFGPIGLTKKACEPGAMGVETALIGVLGRTVEYTIEADVLTLDAGNAGLLFRAAS